MSQTVMNSTPILTLPSFASETWVTSRLSTGETYTTDWRGGPLWEMVLKGELGYCSLSPFAMAEHVGLGREGGQSDGGGGDGGCSVHNGWGPSYASRLWCGDRS